MLEIPGATETTLHSWISHAHGLVYGFVLVYRRSTGLGIGIQFPSTWHTCRFAVGTNVVTRKWSFMGMTYDPVTKDKYCFYDNEYTKMDTQSATQSAPKPLAFAGNTPFFLDNIFYFPKYSTGDEISAIYNLSKFFPLFFP